MQIFVPSVEQETFTLKKKRIPRTVTSRNLPNTFVSWFLRLQAAQHWLRCQIANCIHVIFQGGFQSCRLVSGAEQTVALSNEY